LGTARRVRRPDHDVYSPFQKLAMAGRFLIGLRRFLSAPAVPPDHRGALSGRLRARETAFLEVAQHGIFGHPPSPYGWLMRQAGIEFGDVRHLVASHGVDGALGRLFESGVHLTLDEFKGRRAIHRGAATLAPSASDFDNPLLTRHYVTQTSGSRGGGGTRLIVDLKQTAREAACDAVFLDTFGLRGRPQALWRPAPPGSAGLRAALFLARLGVPLDRWFSPVPVSFRRDWQHAAFMHAIHAASRACGRRIPMPEFVPLDQASTVAGWLAGRTSEGRPAHLNTTASAAVRVVAAARHGGLDIAGTFFRVGGEPLSRAKVDRIRAAGCDVVCHYSMAETGRLGIACGARQHDDEVHVMTDKIAVIERDLPTAGDDSIRGLLVSTLQVGMPKIMLNVEVGDSGILTTRACGCPWDALGFGLHLHAIRSYEKLTSEGMHFVGTDLAGVLEEVLPARFGGEPTDYQFVEQEHDGLPQVSLIMSPRLPLADPADVARTVLDALAAQDTAHRMMAAIWGHGGTLRVVRAEPRTTRTGKTPPLYIQPSGVTS